MSGAARQFRIDPPDLPGGRVELRVKAGDCVKPGDMLAVVETDKASQELEAFEAGRIVRVERSGRGFLLTMEESQEA